jgi:4-hydroxybenzoate polyprenyltransferase
MSSIELVRGYFTERYRASFFVPLAILLYFAGALTLGVKSPPWRSINGVIAAYALVLAFRIRDDVADREVDRKLHPGRITVAVDNLAPLTRIVYVALSIAFVLVALSPDRYTALTSLATVTVLLFGWYRLRESLRPSRFANAAVVLLKYPAIAFVAGAAGTSAPTARNALGLVTGLTAIYLVACIYERLHDRGVHT